MTDVKYEIEWSQAFNNWRVLSVVDTKFGGPAKNYVGEADSITGARLIIDEAEIAWKGMIERDAAVIIESIRAANCNA